MLLIQACSSDSGSSQEPLNDIYRVEVRSFLNVRATPSKSGHIRGTLSNGTLIEVVEISDGWARISYQGEDIGYVSSDYIVLVRKGRNQAANETVADNDREEVISGAGNTPSHDEPSAIKQEDETRDTMGNPSGNVHFIGDTNILSSYDKQIIESNLCKSPNYIYYINTVGSVPTGKIFDYAPELFDEVVKTENQSSSWWEKLKSVFGWNLPSSNIVLLSYIKDCGLLQAECNSTSMKYLKMAKPEEYFKLQENARHDLTSAIYSMGPAIESAGKEYESRSWFIRGQINTGDFFNIMCDDIVVQNILPHDSFWHKWVFGWIFSIPLAVANRLFVFTGSYLGSLFILMLIIVGLHIIVSVRTFKYGNTIGQAWLTLCIRLFNLFLWLIMISLVIYLIPDMSNIAVMEQSGFSNSVTDLAIKVGLKSAVTKNWFMIAMYWIGTIICIGVNATFALYATLPDHYQRTLFEANKENIFTQIHMGYDNKEVIESASPYTELVIRGLSKEELTQSLPSTMILSFVLSGSLILYFCLFLWTLVLKRVAFFVIGVLFFKRQGYYS